MIEKLGVLDITSMILQQIKDAIRRKDQEHIFKDDTDLFEIATSSDVFVLFNVVIFLEIEGAFTMTGSPSILCSKILSVIVSRLPI